MVTGPLPKTHPFTLLQRTKNRYNPLCDDVMTGNQNASSPIFMEFYMSLKYKANHRFALSLTAIATSTLLSGFALAQTAADEPEKVVVTGSIIRRSAAETT